MQTFDTLAAAEEFIFYALPQFSRIGDTAYKPGLDRMWQLMEILNNPHLRFPSLHIAGTNGKGSVTTMLSGALKHAGYKVGQYTSPHILSYRERVQITGEWIDEDYILDFTNSLLPHIEDIRPSFFEFTVALALSYFADRQVDIAVIEVGMGGTYDSTNIISPEVSVITNVGKDHQNTLGNTLAEIASNKAGIIKENTPVVVGAYNEETRPVFEAIAVQKKSKIYWACDEYVSVDHQLDELLHARYQHGADVLEVSGSMRGHYQIANMGTALMTAEVLEKGYPGLQKSLLEVLPRLQDFQSLHGRWERVSENPTVIYDVCHNVDGVREAMLSLAEEDYDQIHLVLGFSSDKDASAMLELMPPDALYYVTAADSRRAYNADALMKIAKELSRDARLFDDARSALDGAKVNAKTQDIVLVLGSAYLIGELY